MESRYSKLLKEQKLVIIAFERKYNHLVTQKIMRLETLVNDLTFNPDTDVTDRVLFPKKLTEYEQSTERKIKESFLEKKFEDLRSMFFEMKKDHADITLQLKGVIDEIKPIETETNSGQDQKNV